MMRFSALLVILAIFFSASVMLTQEDTGDGEGETETPTETPTPSGPTIDVPLTSNATYFAEAGDTLDLIAAYFDIQLDCLRETNDLVPADILSIGDALVLDVDCPAYDGVLDVENPRPDAIGNALDEDSYVVQVADTLDTIGQEFNVSVVAIALANDIDDPARISVGQVLTIPDGPPYGETPAMDASAEGGGQGGGSTVDGETYIVQVADTLDTIGQEFNVSVVAIALVNDLENPGRIFPGQSLIIPDGPAYGEYPSTDGAEGGGRGGGSTVDGEVYVVQLADTLDTIGQEFNVSVVAIAQANDIENPGRIFPGQTLIIPDGPAYGLFPATDGAEGGGRGGGSTVDGEIYVVQLADTLDTIAQEFNVSVVSLALVNELENPGRIYPGQSLVIPDDAPAYGEFPATEAADGGGRGGGIDIQGETYVIQPYETIDGISARFNKLPACVLDSNGIDRPRRIQPGQTIIIPDSCPAYVGGDFVPADLLDEEDEEAAEDDTTRPEDTTEGTDETEDQ